MNVFSADVALAITRLGLLILLGWFMARQGWVGSDARQPLMRMIIWVFFPAMIFSLGNITFGWRKWYRNWRNAILRFGGWVIIRRWSADFKKGKFSQKLALAKRKLSNSK